MLWHWLVQHHKVEHKKCIRTLCNICLLLNITIHKHRQSKPPISLRIVEPHNGLEGILKITLFQYPCHRAGTARTRSGCPKVPSNLVVNTSGDGASGQPVPVPQHPLTSISVCWHTTDFYLNEQKKKKKKINTHTIEQKTFCLKITTDLTSYLQML